MKRLFIAILSLMLLSAVAAACGGSTDDNVSDNAGSQPSTQQGNEQESSSSEENNDSEDDRATLISLAKAASGFDNEEFVGCLVDIVSNETGYSYAELIPLVDEEAPELDDALETASFTCLETLSPEEIDALIEQAEEEESDAMPEPIEERLASDIGITEDTITVAVIIADLEGLRNIGYPLPAGLSNETLTGRVSKYFDDWNAAGGINGRMFEMIEISWDPLSPASMENACIEATLDNEIFMAINGSGFNPTFVPCFTEDNDMLFILGDKAPQVQIDASPDRLFALFPPGEVAASTAGDVFLSETDLPTGSTIGILEPVSPGVQAAVTELEQKLEDGGFNTTTITVNTLSGDNAAANAEAAAAVSQFNAEGAQQVFVLLPFINTEGFFGEIGKLQPEWGVSIIDVGPGMCTQFGASRTNPAAEGAKCITSTGSYTDSDGTILPDSEFEAQCRENWLRHFPVFEGKSDIGTPSGEVGLETADGELLNSDYAPNECMIMRALYFTFQNAGVNPTRDSVADALKQYVGPAAQMSNKQGAFGPDKNYFATQMWEVEFRVVSPQTPRGADGLFNGCPAPTNCWVPVTGNWIGIK